MTMMQAHAVLDCAIGLGSGWDGYRADPPDVKSIDAARGFLNFLTSQDRLPTLVSPSAVGGIGVTFAVDVGERSVYIEFRNTGNSHAALIEKGSRPIVFKVERNRAGYAAFLERADAWAGRPFGKPEASDE